MNRLIRTSLEMADAAPRFKLVPLVDSAYFEEDAKWCDRVIVLLSSKTLNDNSVEGLHPSHYSVYVFDSTESMVEQYLGGVLALCDILRTTGNSPCRIGVLNHARLIFANYQLVYTFWLKYYAGDVEKARLASKAVPGDFTDPFLDDVMPVITDLWKEVI